MCTSIHTIIDVYQCMKKKAREYLLILQINRECKNDIPFRAYQGMQNPLKCKMHSHTHKNRQIIPSFKNA